MFIICRWLTRDCDDNQSLHGNAKLLFKRELHKRRLEVQLTHSLNRSHELKIHFNLMSLTSRDLNSADSLIDVSYTISYACSVFLSLISGMSKTLFRRRYFVRRETRR